jgi:hypothetical protein
VAIFSIFLESMGRRETRILCSIGRQCGFNDRFLLGSYTECQFKERTRVKFATFKFVSEKLGLFLHKKNTPMRNAISVETRIAISLSRLGTGNGQLLIGDLYGVVESTVSIIVREFCKAVRQHLQRILVQMPSESQFRILAKEFEALHGIMYVVGEIDGSHILVLAPIYREKIITVGNPSIQQFFKKLLMCIANSGITNSVGPVVSMIGLFFKLQKLGEHVWRVNYIHTN